MGEALGMVETKGLVVATGEKATALKKKSVAAEPKQQRPAWQGGSTD